MIETLFGYSSADKHNSEGKKESLLKDPSPQYVLILDPKKSQNLAISLKALNVRIEEVCDALREGNFYANIISANLCKNRCYPRLNFLKLAK